MRGARPGERPFLEKIPDAEQATCEGDRYIGIFFRKETLAGLREERPLYLGEATPGTVRKIPEASSEEGLLDGPQFVYLHHDGTTRIYWESESCSCAGSSKPRTVTRRLPCRSGPPEVRLTHRDRHVARATCDTHQPQGTVHQVVAYGHQERRADGEGAEQLERQPTALTRRRPLRLGAPAPCWPRPHGQRRGRLVGPRPRRHGGGWRPSRQRRPPSVGWRPGREPVVVAPSHIHSCSRSFSWVRSRMSNSPDSPTGSVEQA